MELVVIVDLGHENCEMIKSDVESLGVRARVCSHDVTEEELDKIAEEFGEIRGFILNGGPHKTAGGFRVEPSEAVYDTGLPTFAVDYASLNGIDLFTWPKDEYERRRRIGEFLKDNGIKQSRGGADSCG